MRLTKEREEEIRHEQLMGGISSVMVDEILLEIDGLRKDLDFQMARIAIIECKGNDKTLADLHASENRELKEHVCKACGKKFIGSNAFGICSLCYG